MMNRRNTALLLSLLMGLLLMGACSNNVWEELPSRITTFISEYFPEGGVKRYKHNDESSVVQLTNGATLTFDSENSWTEVDGNGVHLPEVFVYDQLPPALYNYLQGIEAQNDVYCAMRDAYYYKLTMHDTVISYEISTGKITYPDGRSLDS